VSPGGPEAKATETTKDTWREDTQGKDLEKGRVGVERREEGKLSAWHVR